MVRLLLTSAAITEHCQQHLQGLSLGEPGLREGEKDRTELDAGVTHLGGGLDANCIFCKQFVHYVIAF